MATRVEIITRIPLPTPEAFFGFAAVDGIVEGVEEEEDISDGT
jgi:hypothetical protein